MFFFLNKFFEYLNSIPFNKFCLLLIFLIYTPISIFGYFIQDDLGIVANIGSSKFAQALSDICQVNNNRPLSCFYHAILTRLPAVYQFYFLINLIFYICFVLNIIKIFEFIFNNIFLKKIFFIFLIFPFFSFTIIYSPAMQSMGTFALLLWSVSLYFLKKFIINSNKINIISSFIALFASFLVYESPLPLLAVSIFFPLFFEKKKKLFLINFLAITIIVSIIFIIQKFLIPIIYNVDLSRVRIDFYNYKKIIYLFFINLILTANILFHSLEIFLRILYDLIYRPNYLFISQLILILIIFYSLIFYRVKIYNQKINKEFIKISLLIFFSTILLNSIMHTMANTGLEFIQYNNRALVSLSFIFAFGVSVIYKYISENNRSLFSYIIAFLFLMFVSNFFYFNNNLIKEKFQSISLNNLINLKFNNNDKKQVIFFSINNRPILYDILSYNSWDYLHILNNNMPDFLNGNKAVIYINSRKFCNKFYFNEYIYKPFNKNYVINYLNFNTHLNGDYRSYNNVKFNELEVLLKSQIICDDEFITASKKIMDQDYLDLRYRSHFLIFLYKVQRKL